MSRLSSGDSGGSASCVRFERWIHGECQPDLTILFDVPPDVSRARLDKAKREGRPLDKFEREAEGFFERVRNAYLERARGDPRRFRVVDSTRPLEAVRAQLGAWLADVEETRGCP